MILLNILIFLFSLVLVNTDPITLSLDTSAYGTILKNGGLDYYVLTIPEGTEKNTNTLVFRIKETDNADAGIDDFSDPDIYVSKTEQNPSSPYSSQWYSERYGEDILTIPDSEVFTNETFYIGVFCEKKCAYEVTATLGQEYSFQDGNMYSLFIPKGKSMAIKFVSKTDPFEELEFVSFSPKMDKFRMYVAKEQYASSQNTLTVIPSWIGGYSVNVYKDSPSYCNNCTYNVILESEEPFAHVLFMAKYEDSVTLVNPTEPVFSSLKPGRHHCYSLQIEEKNNNENIIIQTTLFSGSAKLFIKPYYLPDLYAAVSTTDPSLEEKFTINIHSESAIVITPEDKKKVNPSVQSGDLYMCVTSNEYTSYLVKMYFESQTEALQRYNFLFNGIPLNGYLPAFNTTKYRVIEFSEDSNITISMTTSKGNASLYGYICEEMKTCNIDKQVINNLYLNSLLILPKQYTTKSELYIPNALNVCHQKANKDDSQENEREKIACGVVAIIYCEGPEECIFQLSATHDESPLLLQPRKPHYNVVPYGEIDYYKIVIEDPTITKLIIILNSITGDSDLYVFFGEGNDKQLVADSYNEGYLPDVIRLKPSDVTQENLNGIYTVEVRPVTFASYSLYYYVVRDNNSTNNSNATNITIVDTQPGVSSAIQLEAGHIIRDYFIDNKTLYKVYAFNPLLEESQDLRIAITPVRSEFSLFVFFDLNNLVYDDTGYEKIQGSIWKSTYTNQITISKDDPNYKKQGYYYIVVLLKYSFSDYIDESIPNDYKESPSFYIGVTNEKTPFLLYENLPSSITLDGNYTNQAYWYNHPNVSNPFTLSVNVFYGRVDVLIGSDIIESDDESSVIKRYYDIDTTLINLSPEELTKTCALQNETNCELYIRVVKSSTWDTHFLLVAKSNSTKPEFLEPGYLRTDVLLSGESRNFYINLDDIEKGILNARFISGYGEVYAKIVTGSQNSYPKEKDYEFKGEDNYLGKMIEFEKEDFKNCFFNCKLLISVVGTDLGYTEQNIQYSISFITEGLRINQNQPYQSQIKEGDIQFFSVFFGSNVKTIYVSVTNMDGDVDLFLNYGDKLIEPQKATWWSSTPYNEFIEIDLKDPFFTTNNLEDLSGNYTITLTGYSDSSYTLYITSHPFKIIPVNDDSPASCKSTDEGLCYFRYEGLDLYDITHPLLGGDEGSIALTKNLDMIITTDYLYGSGVIYVKVYNDTDYDITNDLPDKTHFDFSNENNRKASRNMLHLVLDDKFKLNENSMILITVQCVQQCFVDLNTAKMFDSQVKYIDSNRENIFYIYKNTAPTTLIFYNNLKQPLNYMINRYKGRADFTVYTNDTTYNVIENTYNTKYIEYETFGINKTMNTYFNSLAEETVQNKNVFFKISPVSDFSFYIRLTYDYTWTKVKVNKIDTFEIKLDPTKGFRGYFDMMKEYDDVIISLRPSNPNIELKLYASIYKIDKSKDTSENKKHVYDYPVPDFNNKEFEAITNVESNTISIKIPNSKIFEVNTYERLIFQVIASNNGYGKEAVKSPVKFDLLVSPTISGNARVSVEPNKLIYSKIEGINTSLRIFDLSRKDPTDDLLVIDISLCAGDIHYQISSKVNFFKTDAEKLKVKADDRNGGKIILLENAVDDYYYLTVWGKQKSDKNCYTDAVTGAVKCDDQVEMMLYYYTTKSEIYKKSFRGNKGKLLYDYQSDNTMKVTWDKLMEYDSNVENPQILEAPALYYLVISEKQDDYNRMESVCYLSQLNTGKDLYNTTQGVLKDLESNKKYYVNIMAKNLETMEMVAYEPIEIDYKAQGLSWFMIAIIAITILVLIALVVYFYKKFSVTKSLLEYEVNDVRNLTQPPRSEAELKEIVKIKEAGKKYHSLAEDVQIV